MRALLLATALGVAVPALALALAACGEERPGGSGTVRTTPVALPKPPPVGRSVAMVEVSLAEYGLRPARPRVARSGAIAFVATNDGQARHALQVDGAAGEVRSATLRPGERATLVVRLPPGTYKWLCPLADHEERGMTGRVRVAE